MRKSVTLLAACVVVLSGCSQSDPAPPATETVTRTPSMSASPVPSVSSSPSASSASSPATPVWGSDPTSARPTADGAAEVFVTAVRVGEHENFDRVVLDLVGGSASAQTWDAEYVNEPTTQGAGHPIGLNANAYLMLRLSGMAMPTSNFEDVPAQTIPDSAVGNVSGVFVDPPFESYSYIYVGVDQRRDYRVTTLESPARIVIDIHK